MSPGTVLVPESDLFSDVKAAADDPGTGQLRPAAHVGAHRAEGPHPLPQVSCVFWLTC
jgi:hypothetical protein